MAFKRNRLQLLQHQRKLLFVKQGIKILSDKRDALLKEFYGMARALYQLRKDLEEKIKLANRLLMLARSFENSDSITSSAEASQREIVFPVTLKQIWGVKIPVSDYTYKKRNIFERGSMPGYRHPILDKTAEQFENVLDALVKSALLENRLLIIGNAVRSSSRKINALEQLVEPKIRKEIKIIVAYIEEWAREEIFRMKKYKSIHSGY